MQQLFSGSTGLQSLEKRNKFSEPSDHLEAISRPWGKQMKTKHSLEALTSICEFRRKSEFGKSETAGSCDAGFWNKMIYAETELHKSM